MKMRNKGKVHPSPTTACASNVRDSLSVLNLLPAAILAIASVLSLDDREVLAYMVTRTMSTFPYKKKLIPHKSPLFDCECFDCYTTYWFRWDSSPNRELIHQVIEAFEEHFTTNEHCSNNNRNKKKDKVSRRNGIVNPLSGLHSFIMQQEKNLPEIEDDVARVSQENEVLMPEITDENGGGNEVEDVAAPLPETTVRATAGNGHKGLARKVLPDVLGLFNSRLWNLWSPNV